ncbi:unnamed protein product [Cylicocyclus nassatus]|uniref:Uncharacterized protein n=1 Tax=Cylicocyclus nassatus TaxID=53992 RepID=A0AA36H018_CYLNA|nr:unnamed protein product [Cylicocyclus nassatus]
MSLLFPFLTLALFICQTYSAGGCDLNLPPKSWTVTKARGITRVATIGARLGQQYCISKDEQYDILEIDYHIDLPSNYKVQSVSYMRTMEFQNELKLGKSNLGDNPHNKCNSTDPSIVVCFPFCRRDYEQMVVDAALSSGDADVVAKKIKESLNKRMWAITVLDVDYTNPQTKINATMFLEFTTWCSVYIGRNPPPPQAPYLFEIQLAKIMPFWVGN